MQLRGSYHYFIYFLLVSIPLVVKYIYIDKNDYWLDEAYTAWFVNSSYYDLWFWVPSFESHPPLYYTLVKTWNIIVSNLFVVPERYFSYFLSIALTSLIFLATKKIGKQIKASNQSHKYGIFFFIGFSPLVIQYSVEARPYMLLQLSFLVALYGAISIYSNDVGKERKNWLILTLGVVLTNWSHNLGSIYSFVIYIVLIVYGITDKGYQKTYFRQLLYSVGVAFTLSLPLLSMVNSQLNTWQVGSWINEPDVSSVYSALSNLYSFHFLDPLLKKILGAGLPFLFLSTILKLIPVFLMFFGISKLWHNNQTVWVLLLCIGFLVPCITLTISLFGPNIFLERTLLPSIIPYYILLALSLSLIEHFILRSCVMLLLIIQLSYGAQFEVRYRVKEPWKQITQDLISDLKINDLVFLLPNTLNLPISYYDVESRLENRTLSIPAEYPAINVSTFYPAGTPAVPGVSKDNQKWLTRRINKIKGRIILVTRMENLFDPKEITRTALEENFKLSSETSYMEVIKLSTYIRK